MGIGNERMNAGGFVDPDPEPEPDPGERRAYRRDAVMFGEPQPHIPQPT